MEISFGMLNSKKYKCKCKDYKIKFNHKADTLPEALGMSKEELEKAHEEAGRFHAWTAIGADTRSKELEEFLKLPECVKIAWYLVVTHTLRQASAGGGEAIARKMIEEDPEIVEKLKKAVEEFADSQKEKPKTKKSSSAQDSGIM